MNRALAVLVCGAFLTLVVGVLGSGEPLAAALLGVPFTVLGTLGFGWVERRGRLAVSALYVAVQLGLAVATFAFSPGVGATLFLVVVVSQCVLLLPLPATALVVAAVPFLHVGMAPGEALREGFGLLASVLFAAVVTELLRREQRARGDLTQAHDQLRDHAAQAERLATAQERNRVARDIHDGLGHSLTVVQMQVKAARAVLPTDTAKADAVLEKAQRQAEAALAEVRQSVRVLREPRALPPLPEALRTLADETSAAGVPTRLAVSGSERTLPDDAAEALFRAAQEGLTNVRKHAGATAVELRLDYADGAVRVEVHDDGTGPDPAADPTGFGLVGLRERAIRLGGTVHLASPPGGGCVLTVEVPG